MSFGPSQTPNAIVPEALVFPRVLGFSLSPAPPEMLLNTFKADTSFSSPSPKGSGPGVAQALNPWLTNAGFRDRAYGRHLSRKAGLWKHAPFEEQHATKHIRRNRYDLPASVQSGGRKRKQSIEHALEPNLALGQKRQRASCINGAENAFHGTEVYSDTPEQTDPIAFWAMEGRWPEERCWPEEASVTDSTVERLLARKKSSSRLSRGQSGSATSTALSNQEPREKGVPYRDPRYETLLETKGSYLTTAPIGLADASHALIQPLLEKTQPVPRNTLFRDDIFKTTCRNLHNKNKARIIRDIGRLVVPSAETLATFGAKHLGILTESVDEEWDNSIPFTGTCPRPDYSVGFNREAFTEDQLAKLSPLIGDFLTGDQSFFMSTYYMYFPFLTCEVQSGAGSLDIADRKNAHSMALAVRAVAELFRALKREDEVHRQILGFSISHDDRWVRIYGHYPVIDGKNTRYYRHPIYESSFLTCGGKEKWAAYRFTRNVYDVWVPAHFKMICSAIDQLPSNLDFDVASLPEAGLSQDLGNQHVSQSDADSVPLTAERDSRPSNTGQEKGTPGTSFTDRKSKSRG
ncbi:hypothetical protein O1611_g4498 [Lasiodiplodia mahajangana]|uniref:Uncharacterized protein n=1 Tax=Lasiodiplodia mahajangana TaxID=1108764 RepID=A0ACC2JNT4_9PEZI|nr:hypothetical protein O1611_g4498 [Lasiodiplodia mahajangana]